MSPTQPPPRRSRNTKPSPSPPPPPVPARNSRRVHRPTAPPPRRSAPSKRASQRRTYAPTPAPTPILVPTPTPIPEPEHVRVPGRTPRRVPPRPSGTGSRRMEEKSATPTGRSTRRAAPTTSAPARRTPAPPPPGVRAKSPPTMDSAAQEEKELAAAAAVAKASKVGLVILDGDSVAKSYHGKTTDGMAAAIRHYENQGVRAIAVMPGKGRRTRNVALRIAEREGGVLLCNGDLGGYVRLHRSAARRKQLRTFISRNRQKFNFFGDQLVLDSVLHGATAPHAQRKGWLKRVLGKRRREIAL